MIEIPVLSILRLHELNVDQYDFGHLDNSFVKINVYTCPCQIRS